MTAQVTMKELLEAGVHFGHQTSRWNPKMKPYIFGARNGIYIIDLQKTVNLVKDALNFVTNASAQGKKILFVGTKTQARDVIREQAERSGSPYVCERWLGGTLTNFGTIQGCLNTLEDIQKKIDTGYVNEMPKKERAALDKEYQRLLTNLGGVRQLKNAPAALFVVDPSKEHNAVAEARVLGIPVVAITDTNCDPDFVDYIIPGNDDALKSIRLFSAAVADAILDGQKIYEERTRGGMDKSESTEKSLAPAPRAERSHQGGGQNRNNNRMTSLTQKENKAADVQVEVKRNLKTDTKAE